MRICSYNIEWFDELFNSDNTLKPDPDSIERLDCIAEVLGAIDADLIWITEAPNQILSGTKRTVACLENFASAYSLSTNKALIGFPSPGRQEISVLFNPVKVSVVHSPGGTNTKKNPPFNEQLELDTDDDGIKELYKFYRPPLELEITDSSTGDKTYIVIAHTKSKGIFKSADLVFWERENIRSRRKLYAECSWIRKRVDEWLDDGKRVLVMGDINDGPGMDSYEFQFGKSAVEIIMGDIFSPEKVLKSHIGRPKWGALGWTPSSTRFKDRITETQVNVLIDHILVSQNIGIQAESHKVWNPYQQMEAHDIKDSLETASDHFPVTIELT